MRGDYVRFVEKSLVQLVGEAVIGSNGCKEGIPFVLVLRFEH